MGILYFKVGIFSVILFLDCCLLWIFIVAIVTDFAPSILSSWQVSSWFMDQTPFVLYICLLLSYLIVKFPYSCTLHSGFTSQACTPKHLPK